MNKERRAAVERLKKCLNPRNIESTQLCARGSIVVYADDVMSLLAGLSEMQKDPPPDDDELPELTDAERDAMENMDVTNVLGTWEERYAVAMRGAKRLLIENRCLREKLDGLEKV